MTFDYGFTYNQIVDCMTRQSVNSLKVMPQMKMLKQMKKIDKEIAVCELVMKFQTELVRFLEREDK